MTAVPLDVDQLLHALRAGLRPDYLFFWGHTPRGHMVDRACLSQWYPSRFVIDGVRYATAEHYMMAAKARLFGDDLLCASILRAATPGEAKALGRRIEGFDEATWCAHRFAIVVEANIAKFGQSEPLRAFLLATGERVLVEASPQDRVWGIGVARTDPDAADPARWQGLNLLGFALMAARARLRETEA